MAKIIRLDEKRFWRILSETVEDGIDGRFMEYEDILNREYEEAKAAVREARPTFHNGIQPSMLNRGYVVCAHGDNFIYFYGPSRLFRFYAHEDWGTRNPWKLSDKVRVDYANYTRTVMYSYPYTREESDEEVKMSDFRDKYYRYSMRIGGPLELRRYRSESEKTDGYTRFRVYKYMGRHADVELGEFGSVEDAKKCAYDRAMEECRNGRNRDDSTSRYYLSSPRDVSRSHSYYVAAYEYYLYDEYSYYIYVTGD